MINYINSLSSVLNKENLLIDDSSKKQLNFAENVFEIMSQKLKLLDFEIFKLKLCEFSSDLVFKKQNKIIRVSSSTFPTDYPNYFNIKIGMSKSFNVERTYNLEYIKRLNNEEDYLFPIDYEEVKPEIENALNDLLKYNMDFLLD
jgi:hypothetical protein